MMRFSLDLSCLDGLVKSLKRGEVSTLITTSFENLANQSLRLDAEIPGLKCRFDKLANHGNEASFGVYLPYI